MPKIPEDESDWTDAEAIAVHNRHAIGDGPLLNILNGLSIKVFDNGNLSLSSSELKSDDHSIEIVNAFLESCKPPTIGEYDDDTISNVSIIQEPISANIEQQERFDGNSNDQPLFINETDPSSGNEAMSSSRSDNYSTVGSLAGLNPSQQSTRSTGYNPRTPTKLDQIRNLFGQEFENKDIPSYILAERISLIEAQGEQNKKIEDKLKKLNSSTKSKINTLESLYRNMGAYFKNTDATEATTLCATTNILAFLEFSHLHPVIELKFMTDSISSVTLNRLTGDSRTDTSNSSKPDGSPSMEISKGTKTMEAYFWLLEGKKKKGISKWTEHEDAEKILVLSKSALQDSADFIFSKYGGDRQRSIEQSCKLRVYATLQNGPEFWFFLMKPVFGPNQPHPQPGKEINAQYHIEAYLQQMINAFEPDGIRSVSQVLSFIENDVRTRIAPLLLEAEMHTTVEGKCLAKTNLNVKRSTSVPHSYVFAEDLKRLDEIKLYNLYQNDQDLIEEVQNDLLSLGGAISLHTTLIKDLVSHLEFVGHDESIENSGKAQVFTVEEALHSAGEEFKSVAFLPGAVLQRISILRCF